MDNIPL